MADRFAYLNRFTADYIGHLCELNHIDTNITKTKSDRLQCLCELPQLKTEDETKNAGVGMEDLLRVMQHMENTHL